MSLAKIAVIDVGSNAIRMAIMKQLPGESFEWIYRYRVPLRLGREAFSKSGVISDNTISYAESIFREFSKILRDNKVEFYYCGATSAFREARNAEELKKRIQEKSKIHINKISGNLEAQIALLAVDSFLKIVFKDTYKKKSFILLDLGGGSLEINLVINARTIDRLSVPIGTVRLLQACEQFGKGSAEVNEKLLTSFDKILSFFNQNFSSLSKEQKENFVIIGTGGNFRRILKLKNKLLLNQEACEKSLELQDCKHFSKDELLEVYKRLTEHDYIHRIKAFGLRPDRADVIIPAIEIIRRVVEYIPCNKIYAPELGLIDGMAKALTQRSLQKNKFENLE